MYKSLFYSGCYLKGNLFKRLHFVKTETKNVSNSTSQIQIMLKTAITNLF